MDVPSGYQHFVVSIKSNQPRSFFLDDDTAESLIRTIVTNSSGSIISQRIEVTHLFMRSEEVINCNTNVHVDRQVGTITSVQLFHIAAVFVFGFSILICTAVRNERIQITIERAVL